MGATAVALFAGSPIWLVYTLAGGVALSASMVRPMQSALLPQLARTPEELTAANLVVTTIESSGIFLGPAIGGLLLAATNAETVFAAAAGAFVLAALLVAGIKVEGLGERAPREEGFFREFFAGFSAIGGDRNLRLIIGLYGAQTLIAGALNVLIVVAALELLDLGEAGVGFLNSAVGVGGLFGALAAFALVGRQRLASDFGLGLILWGFPIALVGVFPDRDDRAHPARARGRREHRRRRRRPDASPAHGPRRSAHPRVRRGAERLRRHARNRRHRLRR